MGAVITVWLLSLGIPQTAGVALSSRVQLCTDTCVKTGMCAGPTLPDMIACHINTGHRKDKGFQKQNAQEHADSAEVKKIACVQSATDVASRCLYDLCTLFVGPRLASECRPPPWELRDAADKVYNCTRGDNHGKPTCIRGKARGSHRSVGDGYKEYKAGNETIYVKEYTAQKTWDRAAQQCRFDGARLAVLDTMEKLEIIRRYGLPHWIGLRDVYGNNTFFWSDGSRYRSIGRNMDAKWRSGFRDCLALYFKRGNVGWAARDCIYTMPFLCDKHFK